MESQFDICDLNLDIIEHSSCNLDRSLSSEEDFVKFEEQDAKEITDILNDLCNGMIKKEETSEIVNILSNSRNISQSSIKPAVRTVSTRTISMNGKVLTNTGTLSKASTDSSSTPNVQKNYNQSPVRVSNPLRKNFSSTFPILSLLNN